MDLEEKIALLTGPDNGRAYQALGELLAVSEECGRLYPYLDKFVDMMRDETNSYIRTRGLRLIAWNSKWDSESKLDRIIGDWLAHLEDEKPITARQCIADAPIIAKSKPELAGRILEALEKSNRVYQDSMQRLICRERKKAAREIRQGME